MLKLGACFGPTARVALAVGLLVGLSLQSALAVDSVIKIGGEKVSGEIQRMSATEVVITKSGGVEETIAVPDIQVAQFNLEPPQLKSARNQINNGSNDDALTSLGKIEVDKIERAEIKQDVQFYTALAHCRLAMGGASELRDAGKLLRDFIEQNPDNYHALPTTELLGDVLVMMEKYDDALKYYGLLGKSSHPIYKMRSGVAIGRAQIAQGKYAEAQQAFEGVLAVSTDVTGKQADMARYAANLGKADCMAQNGQVDEGVKLVQEAIGKLGPEDSELNAQAYLTLGKCYRKQPAGAKDALLAFLHVDLLYNSNTQAHSEALYNLSQLWSEVGKQDRALQAMELLKTRYPKSRWAR